MKTRLILHTLLSKVFIQDARLMNLIFRKGGLSLNVYKLFADYEQMLWHEYQRQQVFKLQINKTLTVESHCVDFVFLCATSFKVELPLKYHSCCHHIKCIKFRSQQIINSLKPGEFG